MGEREIVTETLHICREVSVYKIPPRGGGGHKSGEWQVADKIFTGRLRVTATGEACLITLEDSSGKEFATCPVPPGERAQAVEPVCDSSRYFVLRLLDQSSSSRRAFVGLGFEDRSDAFDFNVALSDHEKRLQRVKEAASAKLAAASGTEAPQRLQTDAAALYQSRDLSLKEGETIKINVKRPTSASGGFLSANRGLFNSQDNKGVGSVPQPKTIMDRQIEGGLHSRAELMRLRLRFFSSSRMLLLGSSHAGSITWLALDSIESRYLLASAADSSVAAYDVCSTEKAGGKACVFKLDRSSPGGHRYSVSAVSWYPIDTGLFVTGSYDQFVKVWDTNSLQVACSFALPAQVHAVAMSSCATGHCLIAATAADPEVRLCDPNSGSVSHTLVGHREKVLCVNWSPSCEWQLVTGGADGQSEQVRLWDIRASGSLHVFDQHDTQSAAKLRASRKRKLGHISISSITAHEGSITAVIPTLDGLHWVTAGTDSRIRLWDSSNFRNKLVNFERPFNRSIKGRQLAYSECGMMLFHPSGSVVQAFQLMTGNLKFKLAGHMDAVNACCYNEHLQELYTGANDQQICVWSPSLDSSARDRDNWSP